MPRKIVSDEQIIAALLSNGSTKAAAAAVGMTERTLYNRMNEGDFVALYKAAKADLLRCAVVSLNGQIQAAIDTVVEVMTDKKNNCAVRLQAAQTILNSVGKFSQRLQGEEQSVTTQIESNQWI